MSGIDLSLYIRRRNFIIYNLEEVSSIALIFKNEIVSNACNKSIKELLDNKFNVVVVGEFSRGKSMFINALMGKKILPSSTKPTTAILNRISYNQEVSFRIQYRDGKNKAISEENFKEIVAPKEPYEGDKEAEKRYIAAIENINNIEFADIGYPIELCKDGIEIIDTPGTNDLDAAREEITYKFIPKSDTAIFLLSAQQILTQSEMNFLKDRIIDEDIKKVFFVINFKDRINSEEAQQKIIEYARQHLGQVVKNPRIFMVSAKGALNYKRAQNNELVRGLSIPIEDTGFIELEEAMSEFLSIEAGRGKLLKHIQKSMNLIQGLNNDSIKISLASLDIDLKDLEEKIFNIKNKLKKVKATGDEIIKSLGVSLSNSEIEIINKLRHDLEKISYAAVKAVGDYNGKLESDELARCVEGVVAPMQTILQEKMKQLQKEIIDVNIAKVNSRLDHEWSNFEDIIAKEFKIKSESLLSGIKEEDEDSLIVKSGFGLAGMFFGAAILNVSFIFTIPAMIFGGKHIFKFFKNLDRDRILNKAKEQVKSRYYDQVPVIIDNFRKDWKMTMDKVVIGVEEELNRKIFSLESQLDNIINERNKEQLRVDEKRVYLLGMRDRLLSINKDLRKLYDEISI